MLLKFAGDGDIDRIHRVDMDQPGEHAKERELDRVNYQQYAANMTQVGVYSIWIYLDTLEKDEPFLAHPHLSCRIRYFLASSSAIHVGKANCCDKIATIASFKMCHE